MHLDIVIKEQDFHLEQLVSIHNNQKKYIDNLKVNLQNKIQQFENLIKNCNNIEVLNYIGDESNLINSNTKRIDHLLKNYELSLSTMTKSIKKQKNELQPRENHLKRRSTKKVYSKCIHTGSGLTEGRMGKSTFNQLLAMAVAGGTGTYFFRVQKYNYSYYSDGYSFYAKVCNDPEQIEHFYYEYSLNNGYWICSVEDEDSVLKYNDLNGIFRFEKLTDNSIYACRHSNYITDSEDDKFKLKKATNKSCAVDGVFKQKVVPKTPKQMNEFNSNFDLLYNFFKQTTLNDLKDYLFDNIQEMITDVYSYYSVTVIDSKINQLQSNLFFCLQNQLCKKKLKSLKKENILSCLNELEVMNNLQISFEYKGKIAGIVFLIIEKTSHKQICQKTCFDKLQ